MPIDRIRMIWFPAAIGLACCAADAMAQAVQQPLIAVPPPASATIPALPAAPIAAPASAASAVIPTPPTAATAVIPAPPSVSIASPGSAAAAMAFPKPAAISPGIARSAPAASESLLPPLLGPLMPHIQTPPTPAAQPAPKVTHAAVPATARSLFFTQDEMSKIRQAVAAYQSMKSEQKTSNEGQDFLQQLEGAAQSDVDIIKGSTYVYPQFFLESLAYHSPDDWSVRINNQQITSKDDGGSKNLHVMAVDKDKATFQWTPGKADLNRITKHIDASQDGASDIGLDMGTGTVTFTLRPNQTFSSYAMRPLEGKVMPVTETNTATISALPKKK